MDRLRNSVVSRREEVVELTRDLIRFPTVNPPGEAYEPCARFIGDWAAACGYDVQYVRAEGSPGDSDRHPRVNVVARLEGRGPGPCVHFNGHIDVVEVGPGWTVDPFAGTVRDGRVYGRGACDMKGGLAAAMIAVEAFRAVVPGWSGAIEISGTVDEESGGFGGVAHLARNGFFSRPRVDHVIIPEPLDKNRVCLGHRGVWWAEIETHGVQAHGSMPFLGDSAIRHMGAVLERFERDLFPALDRKETRMPVVPDGARRSTLNINSIHGGEPDIADYDGLPGPNVPHSCRMILDRRFLLEERIDDVRSEVFDILDALRRERPGFRYDLREIMEVLPTMTDADAPVVRALDKGIEQVLGRPAEHVISPGTYDQKHIARIGHLHDCIAYGPGRLELAHMADEWIGIDDMVEAATVMALSLDALLTPR